MPDNSKHVPEIYSAINQGNGRMLWLNNLSGFDTSPVQSSVLKSFSPYQTLLPSCMKGVLLTYFVASGVKKWGGLTFLWEPPGSVDKLKYICAFPAAGDFLMPVFK
jgi:hypothetical protein